MNKRVSIITDSTADIPAITAQQYGITVVPVYVRFGESVYRDGVDLTPSQFYEKLKVSSQSPATSQPSPEDFSKVFLEAARQSDGIVSIHISSKISGTYNSALLAKRLLSSKVPIEVIDSKFNSAGLALAVIAAARSSIEGKDIFGITSDTLKAISQIGMFGMFSTMKYLAMSGRVSKAITMAGELLNVKPLLTFRDGEISRAGFVRSFKNGIERIIEFVESKVPLSDLMIVHSEITEKAEELKSRFSKYIDSRRIIISQLGAALGSHGGPGVIVVAVR